MDPLAELLSQVLGALLQSVFDTAFGATQAWANRRKLDRSLGSPAALVARVEPAVAALRGGELAALPDHEWAAAGQAVRDSLALLSPITPAVGYRLLRDPDALRAEVRTQAAGVLAAAGLSELGRRAYELLLAGACEAVVGEVAADPRLSALVELLTLTDLVAQNQHILDLLDDPVGRHQRGLELAFEQRYLDYVTNNLGTFELFGVRTGHARARHSFDDYYVSLALTRRDPDTPVLTGAGTDGAHAITSTRRVLLQGGAGAGKTTFLTRLRLVAARGALAGTGVQWPDAVPFYVPLRRFVDEPFPWPEDLVASTAPALAGEQPKGWASGLFQAGRALLLVDGLDELTTTRRQAAVDWLAEVIAGYPDARFVITSRPSSVDPEWTAENNFVTFDLLPLSDNGIRDFIHIWHAAASARETEAEGRDWLATAEEALIDTLSARSDLRRLASSPLLCGLICALHRQKDMTLPGDRRGLFEAALKLLLVDWDEQRGVSASGVLPRSQEQQMVLLQRFASSMVVNDEVLLPRPEAVERFAAASRGLRPSEADPNELLQRALERTGLLREPFPDHIQFVHRTFRDYLAAREFVEAGLAGLLIDHAQDDAWREVVIMAIAQARPKERATLLQRLLDRAVAARRRDGPLADRLDLIAAICLAEVDVIDPDEVRTRVQDATRKLIPPATFEQAEALARAGSFVLDLLPGPDGLTEDEAARVVHTAACIGGEGAWAKIAPFAESHHKMVLDELLFGWRLSADPEEYARVVLSKVDFGDLPVPVRRWERVLALKHFSRVTAVICIGDIKPLDPLADIPNLRTLELRANSVVHDLSPLAGCPMLRELHLLLCEWLRDLAPLAGSGVRVLHLHRNNKIDLTTLAGVPLEKLAIQHPALARGLHPLPAGLPLRELVVDNDPDHRSLAGVERWTGLEKVEVNRSLRADEVTALRTLPALGHLTIQRAELARLTELTDGGSWPALKIIQLPDLADNDFVRAAQILSVLPGTEILR